MRAPLTRRVYWGGYLLKKYTLCGFHLPARHPVALISSFFFYYFSRYLLKDDCRDPAKVNTTGELNRRISRIFIRVTNMKKKEKKCYRFLYYLPKRELILLYSTGNRSSQVIFFFFFLLNISFRNVTSLFLAYICILK